MIADVLQFNVHGFQFQKCTSFLYSHINLILECHLGICFKTPAPNAKKEPGQQWNLDIRKISIIYSCNNITTTLIRISRLFCFGFFSKTNHQMIIKLTPIVSRLKSKLCKAKKVQKYALNSQLQALQILKNEMKLKIEVFLLSF